MNKPSITNSDQCQKHLKRFNLTRLRQSLKYRPEILKLILKMRERIKVKNVLLLRLRRKLKTQLCKITSSYSQTDLSIADLKIVSFDKENIDNKQDNKQDSSTQTTTEDISDEEPCYKIKETTNILNTQTDWLKNDQNKTSNDKESNGVTTAWDSPNDGDSKKSIAEQVKEVAQNAVKETGMVYVESAGMYYDYKTGYYYNSEIGLYYHTNTGCYYYYSDEKKTFVFHSYPDKSAKCQPLKSLEHRKAPQSDDIENLTKKLNQENEDGETKSKRRKISKESKKKKQENTLKKDDQDEKMEVSNEENSNDVKENVEKAEKLDNELEDGECSETESEASLDAVSNASTSTASDDESFAKHHPPCMRIIVRETNLPKLKVGTLYLITKDGGTIGREGEHHSIILREHNVSRNHLDLKYDMEKQAYFAVDLGSKNGTLLNGTRMSGSQEISSPLEVVHGSTIQLGVTKLLCHIHAGNDTCGHCEPGLILETQEKEKQVAYTRTCSVKKQHQLELARLKNKYAPKPLEIEETAYNDRAQARREKVGSSHHSEKTQSSDVNTFIAPENKGFKLLEKMGWSKGEGLGKDSQGDTEPIPLVSNEGKTGLGSTNEPKIIYSKTLGPATLRLAAKTKMLQPPAKAFQQVEEDSE